MDEMMAEALAEARLAQAEGEVPVGAVVVCGGQIIARDHNRREQRTDPVAHAEILCLQQAAKQLGTRRLRDCTLYVTLEPCPMCAGAMVMSGLGRCVWGAADARMGCCGSVYDLPADPALGGTTAWTAHDPDGICAAVMTEFFQNLREKQE